MQYPEPLPDYYRVLRIGRHASSQDIRAAYRREVRLCHPDLHPEASADAERIRAVNQAHEVLGNPARRAEYDSELARREPPPGRMGSRPGMGRPEPLVARPAARFGWSEPSLLDELELLALARLSDLFERLDELEAERTLLRGVARARGAWSSRRRFGPW